MIDCGQWREAQAQIDASANDANLDFYGRWQLLFQTERMKRLRHDFTRTEEQIFGELKEHIPDFGRDKFDEWERQGWFESIRIDGACWYFKSASLNAARVAMHRSNRPSTGNVPSNTWYQIGATIENCRKTGQKYAMPQTWRITHSLKVKAGAVPAGEVVRVWLPLAQEGDRQRKVRIVSTEPARYVPSEPGRLLRSIYLEKTATAEATIEFKAVYEYEAMGYYPALDAKQVKPIDPGRGDLAPWLAERPPHIRLTDGLKKLAREIVGEETNPLLKARRLFAWMHPNVCWVETRDYSTFTAISEFVREHRWGDCGLQTMFFMALCRSEGIPVRWESGWLLGEYGGPHDWCAIYLEPYGWVPADVTIGPLKSENEAIASFYLGGADNARLIVNCDYGQQTSPVKSFWRSDPIDFQNGEAEWRGGNLCGDQLEFSFKAEAIINLGQNTF